MKQLWICKPIVLLCLMMHLSGARAVAQPLMELSEFLAIVSKSPRIYNFSTTTESLVVPEREGRLNFNYYRVVDSAGTRRPAPYEISQESFELAELGWQAFMAHEPETALEMFTEVLDSFPDYTPVMSKMAQVLEEMGEIGQAIYWYKKALQINPVDYIAAWSLALVYERRGENSDAVRFISHAWIMNRNHPQIRRDFARIAKTAGRTFSDWDFVPQYRIGEVQGKAEILYQPAWLGYAVCQAVWEFETGFIASRPIEGDPGMFRERECLACLVSTMRSDQRNTTEPALLGFEAALKNRMALEFILFEILLPDKPDMAYILDDARINKLIQYIRLTRFAM